MKNLKTAIQESVNGAQYTMSTSGGAPQVEIRQCKDIYVIEDLMELLLAGDRDVTCYAHKMSVKLDKGHLYALYKYEYDNPDTATSEEDMLSVGQYLIYVPYDNNVVVSIGEDISEILDELVDI